MKLSKLGTMLLKTLLIRYGITLYGPATNNVPSVVQVASGAMPVPSYAPPCFSLLHHLSAVPA